MTHRGVTRDRLDRLFIITGVVAMGLSLHELAGTVGLAGWVAMVVGGAITGTLLWPLHRPLGRLPGRWARRLVGGLAGALLGAAASALITVPLRAPLATLATRLPPAMGACAWVAVELVAWLPVLLPHAPRQGTVGVLCELYSATVTLPAFCGWGTADWPAISWLRPDSPLSRLLIVGTVAGALAGAFGLKRWGHPSPSSDAAESAGAAPVSGRE